MHFRSDERAPLSRVGLCRLPGFDEQDVDLPPEGSSTRAFRAALRGLTADQDGEAAATVTESVTSSGLSPRKSASFARRQHWMLRRRMIVVAAALLALLGVSATLLGSHVGMLAFGVGVSPTTVAPTPMDPSGSQAGIASIPVTAHNPRVGSRTPEVTPTPKPPPPPPPPTYTPDGPYSNGTPPPGYPSFAVTEPANDPWASVFGQCVWWAQYKRPDENLAGMGAAMNWANGARARGYTVTSTPAANATVVFAPGVQGASPQGHVSHVEKLLTGGWVLVSEMNFNWNGGGFARVNYRYIHVGSGVWFIH
ncbi:MAG TPA: CHAP domain-containing protein [Ktedonobacterales bacterium]